ncbi:MAG: excisionase family DNA-binding protein [Candidatus Hodarchaeota archaeon]
MKKYDVLTTDEAAKFLRISKHTLLKMIREGKIPAVEVGNSFRFLKNELETFLSGKELKGLERKKILLKNSGFVEDISRGSYINGKLKIVFSEEVVEINDFLWLYTHIDEQNREGKWLIYTTKGTEIKDDWS